MRLDLMGPGDGTYNGMNIEVCWAHAGPTAGLLVMPKQTSGGRVRPGRGPAIQTATGPPPSIPMTDKGPDGGHPCSLGRQLFGPPGSDAGKGSCRATSVSPSPDRKRYPPGGGGICALEKFAHKTGNSL